MSKPKVCIVVKIEDDLRAKIQEACDIIDLDMTASREALLAALPEADGILLSPRIRADAEFFEAATKLRVLSTTSVGYDPFDIPEATKHGVVVCHTPGVLTAAVANLTMGIILALAQKFFENEAYCRNGGWANREPRPALGMDIQGKTLGVVGFGRIGQEVTRRMQAVGMRTLWYDIFDTPHPDAPPSEYRPFNNLLAESDFVSLHTNLDEESKHLISDEQLALMKPTAFLVNTARGGLVDQKALTAALKSGQIAGAGLDVLESEPPDPNDPIVTLPNVITFPHIGTATEETRRAMRELAVKNLLAVLAGVRPPAPVNPEVL